LEKGSDFMSGHSKWATIHRKKGLIDAQRGKIFQKLAKEIMIAARDGGPDPSENPSLRLAIDKAKSANMPKDNIENAIKKATGTNEGINYEQIRYEGYGSSGVAVMVDCLTDNRNRTASLVRNCFTKCGGNLGTDGSVSYMFERKGSILISDAYDEEEMMMAAIDAGADDFNHTEDFYEITTDQQSFVNVREALEKAGVKEFIDCSLTYIPNIEVELDEEGHEKIEKLIENLEDLDDVQDVYYNLKED